LVSVDAQATVSKWCLAFNVSPSNVLSRHYWALGLVRVTFYMQIDNLFSRSQ
jgi:hypothetical protein